MTDHTPLTHCLVLVNERAALRGVALETSLVSAQESKATGFECLLNIGLCTFDSHPGVRVMTIGTADFAFQNRVVVRQLELRPHFQVTLETSVRRLPRIDDRVRRATTLDVQTARAMARLAAHVLSVLSLRLQSRVRRCFEVAYDLFVTGFAFLRADELRARDAGWGENCSISCTARKQNHRERCGSSSRPQQAFTSTVDPSSYSRTPHENEV